MAFDMTLKFEGGKPSDIKGESKLDKREDQIDILAWSWGMSQSGTFHTGGGGGAGRANVQDMSLTKWLDNSTTKLMLAVATGGHIDKATLDVRKAGGNASGEQYLKIVMEKVMVTSVSTGGSGGEDQLTENISLNFAKVTTEYFKQDDKGEVKSAGKIVQDIEKNNASA